MSARSTGLQSYDGPISTETGLSLDSGNWPGFRRCYRRSTVHHAVENLRCDCLRVEIPVEAQAKGSGALGTPERNHDCPVCFYTGHGSAGCVYCDGSGELTASGAPAVRS